MKNIILTSCILLFSLFSFAQKLELKLKSLDSNDQIDSSCWATTYLDGKEIDVIPTDKKNGIAL